MTATTNPPPEARARTGSRDARGDALQPLHDEVAALVESLDEIDRELAADGPPCAALRNLHHYMCLRKGDLRPLQHRLARLGLSSLNNLEAHARPALEAALAVLDGLSGKPWRGPVDPAPRLDDARRFIGARATELFGGEPDGRDVRIMVTLDTHHADDHDEVEDLVEAGMDVARINCAKDTPDHWRRMAEHVRRAARSRGRDVRVAMDLAGPKVRTGPLGEGEKPRLYVGDRLRVTRDREPGRAAPGSGGCASIGCSLPEVLTHVAEGERIHFDDGKLSGRVSKVTEAWIEVEVTHARDRGVKLKAFKGLHLPDTRIELPALGPDDREALDHVVELADVVNFSFCQSARDVADLQQALQARDAAHLGIVAKIETRPAFQALPSILAALLRGPAAGVMIARGDLAVELGYERAAEVQEEILWLCEAAHLPVVWATQVLESLAKQGIPSRAELTDAAMGQRAECVMLNKGDHIAEAVEALDDILRRMGGHRRKKAALLRPLKAFGEL